MISVSTISASTPVLTVWAQCSGARTLEVFSAAMTLALLLAVCRPDPPRHRRAIFRSSCGSGRRLCRAGQRTPDWLRSSRRSSWGRRSRRRRLKRKMGAATATATTTQKEKRLTHADRVDGFGGDARREDGPRHVPARDCGLQRLAPPFGYAHFFVRQAV